MEALRTATTGDVARLCELADELLASTASQRGGDLLVDAERHRHGGGGVAAWLEEKVADQRAVVLVGTLDEVVTGFAVGHVEEVDAAGLRGILDACFVETGARGVGVGRLLLDAVLSWVEARGAHGMDGTALPGDRAAKNFYESAGFKARLLTMHRDFG